MTFKINERVSWVGKIDWDLRKFHGDQLSTARGSSYNSFLIRDEKTVLIDSVWTPYAQEFVKQLAETIDLNSIDYIISTHAEPDHSGALPLLMELMPGKPIYCTSSGVKSLKGYYHKDWNFVPVKTGDRLSIGSRDIVFIEAAMLHWPDTLMAYLEKDNMLFSSDVFGQHYASQYMYSDLIDKSELMYEAIKYYANIVAPYSKKALAKIQELKAMNIQVDMICPAHGMIWRNDASEIIEKYSEWASDYKENKITLIYDTMYGATQKMAESIAHGIAMEDPHCEVKLINSAVTSSGDVLTEIFRSKGILVGSPTYNGGILNSVAAILEEIKGMLPQGKKAAAFGAYGWAAKSMKIIDENLKEAGFEMFGSPLKVQWSPDDKALADCVTFGREFAKSV